jgi:hypothetical protein
MCERGLHEHEAAVCETAAGFTTADCSCFLLCFSALTGRVGDEGVLLEGRGQFWALSWDWKLISCFISLREPRQQARQGDGESADLETRSRGFVLQYSVLCSHAIIDGNGFDDEVDAESLKLVSDAAGIESRQKYRNSAYSVGMQYSERSARSRCLL